MVKSQPQKLAEVWEVFLQEENGEAHIHAGSVHAPDAELALQNARDVFARRGRLLSIWVTPQSAIKKSDPKDTAAFFEANADKTLRNAQSYKVPREVKDS